MTRASILRLAPLGALLFLPFALPSPSQPVGPPWISLEMPANPLDPATRGAAFLVHAYHHGSPTGFPVTGTADGLVDGERQSVDLEFRETSRPGVYAVDQQWPAKGHWIVTVSVAGAAEASVMVELGADGGVDDDRYFGSSMKVLSLRSVRVVQGAPSARRINNALRAMASAAGE